MENLSEEFLGNQIWRYLAALACIFVGYLCGKIAQFLLSKLSKKRMDRKPDSMRAVFYQVVSEGASTVILAISVRPAVEFIVFQGNIENIADMAASILIIMAFALLSLKLVEVPMFAVRRHAQRSDTRIDPMLVPLIGRTLRVVILIYAILQTFQIISGKDMTTILAGLGIASLAFGLAAQESIGNLFGAIFLFTNKPFEIGERCNIDGHDGVIKEMGLTCTRMERLDGHLVTIPNGQLYKKTIHNIGRRPFIRRIMHVTITYDTKPEKIDEAVNILRDLMAYREDDPETALNKSINQGDLLPRVYFNEFNADSLNIICIYWFQPPAYWDYLEHSQWLNIRIIRAFNEAGIDFAFPSQTVYLAGDERRPINLPGLENLPSDPSGLPKG
ncbi:MAG: mechanosensitive ion channel family protein [Verrucomicrobiota bacterium]